ncbi:oligosaccharide flippase family protein [Paraurantiacibacter namhicola]|uniref:Polysaccharide biosynthesis protein n=1 Tax=Paraurantiacibacter namhicola TaxID=645517 RepID=A0A1C7D6Q8_9SPHN|nr:oligosaccharide flippase family protein [Paraurantiacibacter namhicola]ANU07145.1 Polysaccharide biosynthesis protein [Paraurantiacibacter namhicola]
MSTIGRNAAYNLAGFGVPLVLFFLTIPLYIGLIGTARYGVLAIVWLVLGLFGMMDLGLGRAATQRVAALRDAAPEDRLRALGTALASNFVIGLLGALLMGGAAWYIFAHGMKLDPWLRQEALPLVPLMAMAVPMMTTLNILSGALQGRERFFITNRITITNAALFQLMPLAVAWLVGPTLVWLVVAALAARLLAALLLWRACRKEFGSGALARWDRKDMRSMLGYGGWVSVSGLVGMALVFSDRFLIGALVGAVAVTIYAVPLDATRRIAVIADSLANALFPRLAVTDADASRMLMRGAVSALYALATPLVVGVIILAEPLIRFWLGDDIGSRSAPLAQILAIAGWINIFAKPPYAQLQAQDRPRAVALLMLAQLPFFLLALWWVLPRYGLEGAAWVYLARNTVDTFALYLAATGRIERGWQLALTFAALVALVLVLQSQPVPGFLGALGPAVIAGAVSLIIGLWALPPESRERIAGLARRGNRA